MATSYVPKSLCIRDSFWSRTANDKYSEGSWKRFVYWALLFAQRATRTIRDWTGGTNKSSNLTAASATHYTADLAYTRPSRSSLSICAAATPYGFASAAQLYVASPVCCTDTRSHLSLRGVAIP